MANRNRRWIATTRIQRPMVSLRDLRVSYGDREILHGISFDVRRGETMVILGGSGSGKSTLLRTLVGLERPSAGEIWIEGKEYRGDFARMRWTKSANTSGCRFRGARCLAR